MNFILFFFILIFFFIFNYFLRGKYNMIYFILHEFYFIFIYFDIFIFYRAGRKTHVFDAAFLPEK